MMRKREKHHSHTHTKYTHTQLTKAAAHLQVVVERLALPECARQRQGAQRGAVRLCVRSRLFAAARERR